MCFTGARRARALGPRNVRLMDAGASLVSLFAATFVAATLIPLSSELVLFAVLKAHPDMAWAAIAVATLGNTLGGLTTYALGRFIAQKKPLTQLERVSRYGAPMAALAWLPVLGDALILAAGWLKLNWATVALWSAAGRFARYWVVAQGALW